MTWYIVRSASRREPAAETALTEAGFSVYFPRLARWEWGRRSDKKIRVESALFPGYLFVEILNDRFDLVRKADGVHAFLTRGGQPASIPAALVETFRRAEMAGDFDKTRRSAEAGAYRPGQSVAITKGHFTDWPAQVIAMDGPSRVKVLLTAFGRQHEKTLDVGILKAA